MLKDKTLALCQRENSLHLELNLEAKEMSLLNLTHTFSDCDSLAMKYLC